MACRLTRRFLLKLPCTADPFGPRVGGLFCIMVPALGRVPHA